MILSILILSIIVTSTTLVMPPPPPPIIHDHLVNYGKGDGSGLVPIQAEAARTLMASWSEKMLGRKGLYPPCSYEACYEGIQVIGKREKILPPFHSFLVFVYNHEYNYEIVNSHIMICILDPVNRVVNIHGIVENPDNISYRKSIVTMVKTFNDNVKHAACKLEINHLIKWAYGVYHFTLLREMEW